MNEHLLNVPEGNTSTGVTVNLENFRFAQGGSGRVPPGLYKSQCVAAEWVPKKGRAGRNLKIVWRTVEPAKHAGVQIVAYHPAPAGQPGDETAETGKRMYESIVATMADAMGKLEAMKQRKETNVTPAWFHGKMGFIRADDETDNKGNIRSAIKYYTASDEFARNPGPDNAQDDSEPFGANPSSGAGSNGGNGSTKPAVAAAAAADVVQDLMSLGASSNANAGSAADDIPGL